MLWAVFTLIAAAAQTARNAMQRELTATLGTVGATHVRFLFGFPFMTFGLIAGSVLAIAKYGPLFFTDPKILLSFIMWLVYLLLLYTRWSAGWRGRRAALLATFAFVIALGVWAANSLSSVHRFPPV